MTQVVANQAGSGPAGDRKILQQCLAEFLDRHVLDTAFWGVPADPPDNQASWLSQARFFLAVDSGPQVCWQTEKGVVNRRLEAGAMVFLPERSWITVDREQPCRTIGIALWPTFVRFRMVEGTGPARNPSLASHWHHTLHPAASLVYELLARAEDATPSCQRICLAAAVHLLAEHLDKDNAAEMGIAETLFHSICNYLADHVGEPMDRSVAAVVFDRHPSHISELFKTYGNCTFHQYLTRVRLEHARDLLLHTHCPVKATATACGFETQSHFGVRFANHFGMSPAAYRAEHTKSSPT